MIELVGKYSKAKVMIDTVEEQCVAQITRFLNHHVFTNPIVIMPDCHKGNGSCIGFTMEMTSQIIPNIVGVDINCGMLSFCIGKNLKISKEEIDIKIRQEIPFGMNINDNEVINMKNAFPWRQVNVLAEKMAMAYLNKFNIRIEPQKYTYDWFLEKCKDIRCDIRRAINSISSLGGGNHYVELGVDEENNHWVTIHTGSRNFGKMICEHWQGVAVKRLKREGRDQLQKDIEEIRNKYPGSERKRRIVEAKDKLHLGGNIDLKGMEWLEGESAAGYLFDMIFCQTYADINREYIARTIKKILKVDEEEDKILTCHNFIDFKDFMIRKGAIRSYEGERVLIPFNMRDGMLICEGKSNPEWNYSGPHGAGRIMSRGKAKSTIKLEDFEQQMKGIYSTSVNRATLDEAPGVYKDAKIIEEAIEPTVKIIKRIKPILNMKDSTKQKSWKERRQSTS